MAKTSIMGYLRRTILWLVVLVIMYIIGLLLFGTATDFQPPDEVILDPIHSNYKPVIKDSILSFTIWNLGFGGLGRESNFFYDNGHFFFSGGKSTRTPLDLVRKNISGILSVVDSLDSDFFLFQEVDLASRRSYYLNELEAISHILPAYVSVFATNFQVPYVPIPIFEPWHAYGKAHSGLASFSKFQPHESIRLQLPGDFAWPKRVFLLDRCLSLQRFPTGEGKELVVVNIHNSAYDDNGELKLQQLQFIRDILLAEYEKGNYVVAGGDWNMCPPFFRFDGFMPGRTQGFSQINIPDDLFPPEWLWIYDAGFPSHRKTRTTYEPGTTFVTLIDFYLISPNIKVREIKTINLDFRYSDHQPVWMEVELI